MSIAVMPPPITSTLRPTGKFRHFVRLTQFCDVLNRIDDTVDLVVVHAQLVDATHTEAEENGIVFTAQVFQ